MADLSNRSPLAPTAVPPSVVSSTYEVKYADNRARRGPLRFEEGLATDPSLAPEFVEGMRQGYAAGPHGTNVNVYEKDAATVERERTHFGSAAWTEAPTYLSGFAGGASNEAERRYVEVMRDGQHYLRRNPAVVTD
jgi:hypothetical protein